MAGPASATSDVGRRRVLARVRIAPWGAGLAGAGLVAIVTGTFLPWLRSGTVLRNSYQAAGTLRVLLAGGPVTEVLTAWLFVAPACGVGVALYALRLRRSSATVSCVVSLAVATVAALATAQSGNPAAVVGTSMTGPVVALIGAVAALVGSTVVLVRPIGRTIERGGVPDDVSGEGWQPGAASTTADR